MIAPPFYRGGKGICGHNAYSSKWPTRQRASVVGYSLLPLQQPQAQLFVILHQPFHVGPWHHVGHAGQGTQFGDWFKSAAKQAQLKARYTIIV
jgi:hypothetical protein